MAPYVRVNQSRAAWSIREHDEGVDGDRCRRADDERVDLDRLDSGVREARDRPARPAFAATTPCGSSMPASATSAARRAASSGALERTTRSSSSTATPPRPTARIGPKSGSRVIPQSTSVPASTWRATSTGPPRRSRRLRGLLGRRDAQDDASVAGLVRGAVELHDDRRAELLRRGRRLVRRRCAASLGANGTPKRSRTSADSCSGSAPGRAEEVGDVRDASARRERLERRGAVPRARARASRRAGRAGGRRRARARAPGSGAADRRCAPSSSRRRASRARRARRASVRSVSSHHSSFVGSRNWERSAWARRMSNSPDAASSSSERG